jgi:hypothetical protein
MDKLLLTAFLSALAGFLTATLSIVKLVNEKESKTTEYRQAWTDSVRKSFSELIGLLNAEVANLNSARKNRLSLIDFLSTKPKEGHEELHIRAADFSESRLKARQASAGEMRRELYKVYAFTRLHFKPDDLSFSRVEQHFNLIMTYLKELEDAEDERASALQEKVHAAADEITAYSRSILKTEWETVKKGERAYQLTKRWSIAGSIVMLFILISIGTHAVISMWKDSLKAPEHPNTVVVNENAESKPLIATSSSRTIGESVPSIQISNVVACKTAGPLNETRKSTQRVGNATNDVKPCVHSNGL